MPPLFEDRTREAQIVLAVVVPFLFGVVTGVFLGISAAVVLGAGEHWPRSEASSPASSTRVRPPAPSASSSAAPCSGSGSFSPTRSPATDAKVSLGGFPPLLILIDAIIGAVLGAIGGAISRSRRAPAA